MVSNGLRMVRWVLTIGKQNNSSLSKKRFRNAGCVFFIYNTAYFLIYALMMKPFLICNCAMYIQSLLPFSPYCVWENDYSFFLSVRSETSISYKYILIVRNILGNLIYVLTSSMYWNTIFYNLCEFVRLWFSSYQLPKQNFSAFLGTNTATYVNVSAHFVAYLKNKKLNISRASFSLAYNCSCYVEASIN